MGETQAESCGMIVVAGASLSLNVGLIGQGSSWYLLE
jgi:hypothetical protein